MHGFGHLGHLGPCQPHRFIPNSIVTSWWPGGFRQSAVTIFGTYSNCARSLGVEVLLCLNVLSNALEASLFLVSSGHVQILMLMIEV